MAAQGRRKTSAGRQNTGAGKRRAKSQTRSRARRPDPPMDLAIRNEIFLFALAVFAVFLFLCNFGLIGKVGAAVSSVMFGMFGLLAYAAPLLFFLMIAFGLVNGGNAIAARKLAAGVLFFLLLGMGCEFFSANPAKADAYQIAEIYRRCSAGHEGGGVLSGSLAYLACKLLGAVGAWLLILALGLVCLVVITEKSLIGGMAAGGRRFYERSLEDAAWRRERALERREAQEEERIRREEERRSRKEERLAREEEQENEKLLRMEKKVSGVMLNTALEREEQAKAERRRDDMHEITLQEGEGEPLFSFPTEPAAGHSIHMAHEGFGAEAASGAGSLGTDADHLSETRFGGEFGGSGDGKSMTDLVSQRNVAAEPPRPAAPRRPQLEAASGKAQSAEDSQLAAALEHRGAAAGGSYRFPSVDLLDQRKGKRGADSDRELEQTARRLEQILADFGVKVSVSQYSRGPSVTRYELQPEQGVKVSRIVSLTDDIKLNLAATDIRIEAPIPGKAAVGIEVPNKDNTVVPFRELVESQEFREFSANLVFAVGKDIGGKIVLADIARMPHLLIAGSTGSGKSVCINTIVMGILYKAHPDDVKLIMIDPKVVELSVYNGIPHLMIPVVTDPKKAAAALHWGVAEMTERYKKFADLNVRDLKGYNKKAQAMQEAGEPDAPSVLPQILIIVDELADLMMVAPGEVEESICRLAQLARACGIHLIIATQRPSVDVITGLIKANMPSRVAFAVSSGVDSRTILDMVGAEKLLGKGDMLFYPQGYPKPSRIQGPFVSDDEVSRVVDFLKEYAVSDGGDTEVEERINSMTVETASSSGAATEGGDGLDEYFVEAGRFIIEKDKASIGMLQRMYKIGFNRAARIMDQLAQAGVVGEEEGTKPRKILMSAAEFEEMYGG